MDRATVPGFIPDFKEQSKNGRFFKGELIKCAGCGKEVYRRQSLIKRSKFMACSKGCASKIRMLGKTPWNKGKGETRSLMAQIRECKEYEKWRSLIFRRDHFTCQICGVKGEKVEADHHPKQFSKIFYTNNINSLEEALSCKEFWDISNGRTLCKKCHKKHGKRGYYKGRRNIIIFGGSGFLGSALIARLITLNNVHILTVARNEGALVLLKEKFPLISIMVGDIADPWIVKKAMVDADEVYLLSAQKHVGLSEVNVNSCISTNIAGTMNVVYESLFAKPGVLVFISSDKAGQPSGVYGCSKKIGEKLMEEAGRINPKTKYRVVRYGNILYSTGSVLCKWRDRMQKGEEVVVTDVDATRFFWSVDQAIDLIFDCIKNVKDASPYYTAMKSIRIGDLLEAMKQKYGQVPVKTIGLQAGENKHEIIADNIPDSFHSERYTKEEILELI